MHKFCFALLFVVFHSALYGQYLHTPEEMSRIMSQSSISYIIDTLAPAKSNIQWPTIEKGWWTEVNPEGIELKKQPSVLNKKATLYFKKGENFYSKQKYSKAIEFCEKAHNQAPGNIEIIKRIGRSYGAIGKTEVATTWYKKALELNRIDFEAHFLLADIYAKHQDKEAAIHHITIAHVLNRNHPDILNRLHKIYDQFDQPFGKWDFEPVYHLTKVDDQNIQIKVAAKPWAAYANCKAIWKYEPGYREKMKNLSNKPSETTEENECLLNALISYEKMEGDPAIYPELALLKKAIPDHKVNLFILYEIESKREPLMVSRLPETQLNELVKYVKDYRQ